MGIFRRRVPAPLTEAASPPLVTAVRRGYDADIPAGGTTDRQQSITAPQSRQQSCDEMFGLYMGCAPASTAVDAIARTVTAGGLDVVSDTSDDERLKATPTVLPPNVMALKGLIAYVNPADDIRQLCRNAIVDLLVTGDAFLEVTWTLGVPSALWNLDSGTMVPIVDSHGQLTGYKQVCGPGREVDFGPDEIIHIRMDAPRGGVYGVSPTSKLHMAILNYIWTAALLKETMRQGNPPRFHMRFAPAEDNVEIKRFRLSYAARHLGVLNIGAPLISKGAEVQEFKVSAIAELLTTLADTRDIILSGYGVPGRKVGVAEPGSLGGTGAELGADRTFRINTCGPMDALVLEKLNFALLRAFGITEGWKITFGDVDWRDDETLEKLRDMRLRNGSWTLNRVRDDMGEPPVDGGDVPVLVDRQNLVAWSDLPALSKATVAATAAKGASGVEGPEPQTTGALPAVSPTVGKSESFEARFAAEFARRRLIAEDLERK